MSCFHFLAGILQGSTNLISLLNNSSKSLADARLSVSNIVNAAAKTGTASNNKKDVIKIAQTKRGIVSHLSCFI